MRGSLSERYWAKVDRRGPDECWPWTGALRKGYGAIGLGGRGAGSAQAHRIGYEMANGPIPDGLVVDHECHNRSGCTEIVCAHRACQNPAHLAAKTQAENLAASPLTVVTHQASNPPCEHGNMKSRCPACIQRKNHEYQRDHRRGRVRSRA